MVIFLPCTQTVSEMKNKSKKRDSALLLSDLELMTHLYYFEALCCNNFTLSTFPHARAVTTVLSKAA